MTKLLHIESSPRKQRSKSIKVAQAFIEAYRLANPDDEVQTIDIWDYELPEINEHTINAKFQVMQGGEFSPEQQQAWQEVVDVIDVFKSADKFLFSVPMWNFGIPYKLKHFIDVIAQPGQTFTYSPETGYSGLVVGKPVAVVYARGGAYSGEPMKSMDLQKAYLDMLLGFIGFKEIQSILVEPTMGGSEEVAKIEAAAIHQAKTIAAKF